MLADSKSQGQTSPDAVPLVASLERRLPSVGSSVHRLAKGTLLPSSCTSVQFVHEGLRPLGREGLLLSKTAHLCGISCPSSEQPTGDWTIASTGREALGARAGDGKLSSQ